MALRDLTPWRPASRLPSTVRSDPFMTLRGEMDRLFDHFWRGFDLPTWSRDESLPPVLMPRLDVSETDKGYEIAVELPGIDEKDIEMTLADGVLTIKGEKKAEKEDKARGHLHVERSYGAFERALALPSDADAEKIDAKFKNGVLTASIAKKPDAKPAAKRIDIKTK